MSLRTPAAFKTLSDWNLGHHWTGQCVWPVGRLPTVASRYFLRKEAHSLKCFLMELGRTKRNIKTGDRSPRLHANHPSQPVVRVVVSKCSSSFRTGRSGLPAKGSEGLCL
jgi:hypothetical protein